MSKTFQKFDLTPMDALVIAENKISKLRGQYLIEQIYWGNEVQVIISEYNLTCTDMARLCFHLSDRFPERENLQLW